MNLSEQPKFLITRLSAIGDCIHTVPMVHSIRARYPKAFIAWATQGGAASLLKGLRGLDELIVVDRNWLKSLKSILSLRKRLRAYRFDVCIDPQSLTKSSALGWLSGAKTRIGFARPQGRELSLWLNPRSVVPQKEHVIERYLELLNPLNVPPKIEFHLPTDDVATDKVRSYLASQLGQRSFAVINPGAGWPSKVWSSERFAQVANALSQRLGLPSVVVWAGDEEKRMAEEIVAGTNHCAHLACSTTLPELRILVEQASLFVGSDTGPLHLAAAVDTPCVAIFGPTNPARCGPYGREHISLHRPLADNQQLRSDDNRAMLQIEAEAVISACCEILSGRSPSHAASA